MRLNRSQSVSHVGAPPEAGLCSTFCWRPRLAIAVYVARVIQQDRVLTPGEFACLQARHPPNGHRVKETCADSDRWK